MNRTETECFVVNYPATAAREIDRLRARLAEAERNEGTLLGMIRHQRDVLRECLPYLNESMAGKRPGRSADDIRAAVKALTTDSAPVMHASDCAVHNEPALPVGPCNCGAAP